MRSFFAVVSSVMVVSSMAVAGCAVDTARDGDDDSASSESAAALSAYGEQLVGSYKIATGSSAGDFTWIVLKNDGTFFTEQQIFCFTTPCINPRSEGKFVGYKPTSGHSYGGLRLITKGGPTRFYRVTLSAAGDGFKLSSDGGKTSAKFDRIGSFCGTTTDCDGQSFIHPMCVGHSSCTAERTCGWKCGVEPVKCDYSNPDKSYVGKSPEACMTIKFMCVVGKTYFADSCGCGCQTVAAPKPCVKSGCSGQICADSSVITTCEWRPEYACYSSATCERDAAGTCGWTKTAALTSCLAGK